MCDLYQYELERLPDYAKSDTQSRSLDRFRIAPLGGACVALSASSCTGRRRPYRTSKTEQADFNVS